ncbi:sigma-54-dependent transcriptional regulator [Poriferisphaera sp. WC338]|uniref:sigma-54-dependent transcriptional regulator n=1 Tax=Poriferisphaera sp. WC338 TaxID=3425129 RepID=UPI003D81957D
MTEIDSPLKLTNVVDDSSTEVSSKHHARILIVDDDPIVAESLAEMLAGDGYDVATACDGVEAANLLEQAAQPGACPFGLLITDMNMPRCNGFELLKNVRKAHPSIVPIVITGFGKIESAVEAVKLGAADYLTKPVIDDELRLSVNKAFNQHILLAENNTLKTQLSQRFGMGNLVGADYRMQKVYDLIEAVAESKTTVLITGQSGTGKSMVGHAVHAASPRATGPFVTFSCGSIPETLLESELFGHVKGAFTGADYDKPGKILSANGGTLFIDEINSATPALQLKLLRVLQEKAFEPVGATETVHVDVRFVLATNQPLDKLVEQGLFREDLYYRINVVNIQLPNLSDRVRDIPLLAEHFLARYCGEMKRERRFSENVIETLQHYGWPGNVRELENAVERAVVLSRKPVIEKSDLPDTILNAQQTSMNAIGVADQTVQGVCEATAWLPMPLSEALQEPEKQILLAALEANQWNRQETAKQLDINRTTLYKKIKFYNLDQPA